MERPALRELRKLDKPLARSLLTAVTKLSLDPRPPGVRALIGQPPGTMRLRIGDYHVVYVIQDDLILVTVVRVTHRREVYCDLWLQDRSYCDSVLQFLVLVLRSNLSAQIEVLVLRH